MTRRLTGTAFAVLAAAAVVAGSPALRAQQAQGAPPPAVVPPSGRAGAPIDLTGTWASVVTEDWQWRFVTPIVGDYTGVPLNADGDRLARQWNPDADAKAGLQCKGFGAAAINRLPTRMQVSWVDDNTMKLDFDLGTQSRLVYFDKSKAPGARSLQGHAVGEWIDLPAPGRGGPGGPAAGARAGAPPAAGAAATGRAGAPAAAGRAGRPGGPAGPRAGGLKIVTTNLLPQYLRQNGVPVSDKAVITEYLDVVPSPDGSQWLVLKSQVDDPTYLSGWYIVSSNFKKEATAAKWSPTPCELLPRLKGTATQVPRQGGE
jgi:hypothetical protein